MGALGQSLQKTIERHERRQQQRSKSGYAATAEGEYAVGSVVPRLAAFMASGDCPRPPNRLQDQVRAIDVGTLATVALVSLLNWAAANEDEPKHQPAKQRIAMGVALHRALFMAKADAQTRRRLKKATKGKARRLARYKNEWTDPQKLRAGNWLLRCCKRALPEVFVMQRNVLKVRRSFENKVVEWAEKLCLSDPVFEPSLEPLRDWTDWRSGGYWNEATPIAATFVNRASAEKAIRQAFRDGSMNEHLAAVNAMQRVGFTINAPLVEVVERFGCEIGKARHEKGEKAAQRRLRVAIDLGTARRFIGKTFYLPHHCDFRGRVYPLPYFNFQRDDTVRALFMFAEPLPMTEDGLEMLAIHAANCGDFDKISKRPWQERIDWVNSRRDTIRQIAANPIENVDKWREADAPFCYVAACIELAAAWSNPNHRTRLPVAFDGSCSGIQHLCMGTADDEIGRLVNLTENEEPQDVYEVLRGKAVARLKDDPLAQYLTRKVVKRPCMTFAYNATRKGMAKQIEETLEEEGHEVSYRQIWRLAEIIEDETRKLLKKPAAAMDFIGRLAEARAKRGLPFVWRSPTGFPWRNDYFEPSYKQYVLPMEGARIRVLLADSTRKMSVAEAKRSAAPNFVHSMDASHLVRVVNDAVERGITNIAAVHDSFACLAPQAFELRWRIGEELSMLYLAHNVLGSLHTAAMRGLDPAELPFGVTTGKLDLVAVAKAEYSFM
jgi:DNA-directed RNA polymerase